MSNSFFRGVLILILLQFAGGIVRAESLNEEQARYAAAEFFTPLSSSSRLRARGRQLVLRSNGHEQGYYIFERPEGGVVFVADDDAIGRTVLGYTDGGSFDATNLPVGLQDWLDQIGILMDAVHEGKINQTNVRRKIGNIVVDALIHTKWNQGTPYNNFCPVSNGKRCITGCVATAMAQVMKYWSWPVHGYGSVSYEDDGCGQLLSEDLSSNYYDWNNMLDTYYTNGNYTSVQISAVATLMRDCGYAVHMHYTPDESGASVSAGTMREYFHYSPMATDRYVENYSEERWHDYIRRDLLAKRPVMYNGQSTESGHEFILDGFDTEGYYHVNWGWGGYQDGWFILTDLNGYNTDQWMINNLMPDYGKDNSFSYSLSSDGVLTISGTGMMPEEYQMKTAPWRDDCNQVRKVVIDEGVTGIVKDFGYCSIGVRLYSFPNMEELILPDGLQFIGSDAFYYAEKLTSVQLPSTLINMNYAFEGCNNLKSLHLPKNLEEFNGGYMPYLAELSVDKDNPWLMVEDNVLYTKNGKHLLFAPGGAERIVIAEATEDIFDHYIFSYGTPIVSKCKDAPDLSEIFRNNRPPFHEVGYIFVPNGSMGYDSWENLLPSRWKIITYVDIEHIPDTKITWTLDEETLTICGWGEQKYKSFGNNSAPYYPNRDQVQKLVVGEGVNYLCRNAFSSYGNLEEAELPSTLSYIDSYCFSGSGLSLITCYARQAPTLNYDVFYRMPRNGTLRVPEGTDYSSWLNKLPVGWQIEYFVPEPMTAYTLYTGVASSVYEQKEWDQLLNKYPNTIGIISPRYKEWAYLMPNVLIDDETAEGGYRCPHFILSDLSTSPVYLYSGKAEDFGFSAPMSFSIEKGEYKRDLIAGYNTVCLPFDISEGGLPTDCHMYRYSHFDSETGDVVFSPQAKTEASHACFLKCESGAEWQIDLSGIVITTQQPVADDNMRGTFVTTEEYKGIGYNPRTKDNIFAPLARYLHPFRACFIIGASEAPAELSIRLSDDETTGLQEIVNCKSSNGKWYNLAGQRISKMQKGVNIIDGKKILR